MRRSHLLWLAIVAALALLATWAGCAGDPAPGTGSTSPDAAPGEQQPDAPPDVPRERVEPERPVAEEPPDTHPVQILVTQPGGAPVPDAELQVARRGAHWSTVPRIVARTRTAADGSAEVSLAPGRYAVRGMHPELQILGQELDLDGTARIELRAAAGPRVVIVVQDEDGDPVAGAVAWERHEHAGVVATSDADGRADLGRVYPSNPFVEVEAPGFLRWSNYVFGTWDGRDVVEVRVRLRRATEVRVRVIEHDGTPAAGALLACGGSLSTSDAAGNGVVRVREFGDASGVRAELPDGREAHRQLVEAPGEGEVITLQLPPLEPLRGRVLHAWTDAPVPEARVLVQPGPETEYLLRADTAADGRFELPHVTREVRIVAFAAGLGPSGEDYADVEPDEDGTYTIRVSPTMRLAGRVVDTHGEPLPGAQLSLITWGERAPLAPEPHAAVTAADGTFAFDAVPAVPDLIVMASTDRGTGWSAIDLEIPPTPDSSYDVGDIVVPDGFDLDVPVVDDDGAPVDAAIVWVQWRVVGDGMPGAHRQVLDGAMDPVRAIPRASAVATITAPGLLKTVQRLDATTEALVVDRACTVNGRVVRAGTAEPVAGVWVVAESKDRLHTLDGNHGGAKTDADGRFTFGGVRRGRYALRVRTEDRGRVRSETDEIDVRARATDLGEIVVE